MGFHLRHFDDRGDGRIEHDAPDEGVTEPPEEVADYLQQDR